MGLDVTKALRGPLVLGAAPLALKPARANKARIDDAPHAPARKRAAEKPLSPRIARALQLAEGVERSKAPEGREEVLPERERRRLAALLPALSEKDTARIEHLLEDVAGDSAANALILRAIHARLARQIAGGDELAAVETFAARLRGLESEEMLRRASAIDLDAGANTSARDPIHLWERRGVIHPHHPADALGDNDGLFQRFSASCGPSVLQMMLAQADPIFAFTLNAGGLASASTHDGAAKFQRELLEHYGGIAIGLPEAQLRARMRNAIGRLAADRAITHEDGRALRAHLEQRARLTRGGAEALRVMREKLDGFPSDHQLHSLRAKLPQRDEGIDGDEFADALARLISPATGVYYRQTTPLNGFARGQAWRHLDAVARALRRGIDVPFGISEPGHWMLLTAVQGRKPTRRFLVSDPLGGRTSYVSERDLVSGKFVRDPFQLSTGRQRGYIDSFFLPVS